MRRALAALDEEQRRIVQFGIRQDELDQAIAEFRKSYENAAASAATRRTKDLARSLIAAIDQQFVFTSPADNLERFESCVNDLTVAEVNASLGRIFEGEGPLVLLKGPVSLEGGDEAVAEEYRKSHAVEVEAPAPEAVMQWAYEAFGNRSSVVERREISDLGVSLHLCEWREAHRQADPVPRRKCTRKSTDWERAARYANGEFRLADRGVHWRGAQRHW